MGISASNRLAAQLGINSAVLKQASRESEWYYRAIQVRQGGTTKRYSTMVGRGGTTEPHRRDAAAAPQEARLPFCIVPCQPGCPRLHCKVQAWAGTPAGKGVPLGCVQGARCRPAVLPLLQPCVHYLPFWVDNTTDILQLVQRLKGHPANDEVARRVASNGQVSGRPGVRPAVHAGVQA